MSTASCYHRVGERMTVSKMQQYQGTKPNRRKILTRNCKPSYPVCSCSRASWPCRAWWTWGHGEPWQAGGTANSGHEASNASHRSASCGTTRSYTCTRPFWLNDVGALKKIKMSWLRNRNCHFEVPWELLEPRHFWDWTSFMESRRNISLKHNSFYFSVIL